MKLREANALLSVVEKSTANVCDPQQVVPANKKVTPQRTTAFAMSRRINCIRQSAKVRERLAKPQTDEIKRCTLLSSWLNKKFKIQQKDRGNCTHARVHTHTHARTLH